MKLIQFFEDKKVICGENNLTTNIFHLNME